MTDYYEHKLDPVGVRPDWLADDDWLDYKTDYIEFRVGAALNCAAQHVTWGGKTAIRIPRDHWAVPYLERGETPPSTKPTASEHPEYSLELVAGREVEVRPHGTDLVIAGTIVRYVEGWPEVEFNDRSTCICRPSSVRAIPSELDKSKEVDPLVAATTRANSILKGEGDGSYDEATDALRDILTALDVLKDDLRRVAKDEAA